MEHRSVLRICISAKDVLLCWMDHFGEGTAFSVSVGYHWHKPYFSRNCQGRPATLCWTVEMLMRKLKASFILALTMASVVETHDGNQALWRLEMILLDDNIQLLDRDRLNSTT